MLHLVEPQFRQYPFVTHLLNINVLLYMTIYNYT